MRQGYVVHARKDGVDLDYLVLQASKKGMRLIDRLKVMHEFANPEVKVIQKLGKSRSLFRVDQKPAWWVEITDCDGTTWPIRCRSLGDAKAIEGWAKKHSVYLDE